MSKIDDVIAKVNTQIKLRVENERKWPTPRKKISKPRNRKTILPVLPLDEAIKRLAKSDQLFKSSVDYATAKDE